MKKIFSRLPVLLVLAAVLLGAGIETASAGKSLSPNGSSGSGIAVSSVSRSGATTFSGDPDVGQNSAPVQKRLLPIRDWGRGSWTPREAWTNWIWAIWNLRVAR